MKIIMPLELLTQAGLTPTQAEILGFLLTQNDLKAREVVSALQKPRGVVYKGLEELVILKLVERVERAGAVTRFRAEHPSRLESLFEARQKSLLQEREVFRQSLPELTTQYNLVNHKPNLEFFEGETGLQQGLEDARRSQTEILTFIDPTVLTRTSLSQVLGQTGVGIRQRVIIAGEAPLGGNILTNSDEQQIEIRYTGPGLTPFKSSVKIYDNKLTNQVFENNQLITVVIEDRHLYEMNQAWFEFLWQHLTSN